MLRMHKEGKLKRKDSSRTESLRKREIKYFGSRESSCEGEDRNVGTIRSGTKKKIGALETLRFPILAKKIVV